MRTRQIIWAAVGAVLMVLAASRAEAQIGRQAFRWVDRPINLPRTTLRLDAYMIFNSIEVGEPFDRHHSNSLFFQGALGVGITDDIEIGFGVFDPMWPRWLGFEGGLLPLELAPEFDYRNPAFYGQFRFVATDAVELAFRVEALLPVDPGRDFTLELGLPLLVRLGDIARLDLGFFFGMIFDDDQLVPYARLPIGIAFNVSPEFFFGIFSGIDWYFDRYGYYYDRVDERVPLGTQFGFTFGPGVEPVGDVRFGFQLPEVAIGFDWWQIFGGASFYFYL